ncbi:MAG TPA: CsgG/HfaB family protein [Leptospiraceae bacterium]|nr:CsgG/HfaB family protein [Leptospiraceae bacterium]HMW07551.1 CsgG/HfaB family protein [Leptospiraceae bacterium]HMX35088.1 CsgG/HfaB family protein [Leptospiraceae bacterium]HMY33148.1 CsgG/HfaB family protein [Leptospiraceae bacterium]HMZ66030.1 CsgG/HfaB family protein [Leptospiraceae bacterium]
MKSFLSFLFLISFFIVPLLSEDSISENEARTKYRVAILDFKNGNGVTPQEAKDITNIIRTEMINLNTFTILNRENLNKILEEQKNIQLGLCDTTDCNIRLGRLLGANKIMTGKIFKLGRSYHINAYLIDIEKGVEEVAEHETTSSLDGMHLAVENLTLKIREMVLNPDKDRSSLNPSPAYSDTKEDTKELDLGIKPSEVSPYLSFLVPGLGQFMNGYKVKGSLFFISFFGLLSLDLRANHDYHQEKTRYRTANYLVSNSFLRNNTLAYTFMQNEKEDAKKKSDIASAEVAVYSTFLILIYVFNILDALLWSDDFSSLKNPMYEKQNGFFIYSKVEPNSILNKNSSIYSFGYSKEF